MRHSSQRRFAQVQWLAAGPFIVGAGGGHWTPTRVGLFALGMAATTYASYGADLDHPRSMGSHKVPLAGRAIRSVSGGHRMGSHSLLAVAVAGLLGVGVGFLLLLAWMFLAPEITPPQALPWVLGAAVALGWWGGIFPDLLTHDGAGVLYPFSRRRVRLLNLRTSPPKPAPMLLGESIFNGLLFVTGLFLAASILGAA